MSSAPAPIPSGPEPGAVAAPAISRAAEHVVVPATRGWTMLRRNAMTGWLSILPAFVLVAIVIWYPVAQTVYHSFTKWNGVKATWIGWKNYVQMFSNGDAVNAIRANLVFVLATPGILVICLLVSILLYDQVSGWKFFRSVYYIPTILSSAVVGLLIRTMFSQQGIVNYVLDRIGLDFLVHDWIGRTNTAFMVMVFVYYWQTLGQGALIFLAGMSAISPEVIEASRLDGANWFQRSFGIVVPLLVPTIAYFVITNIIWAFVGVFAVVFTVTQGGPGYTTTTLDMLVYRKAFQTGDMGYASALAVVLFIIVLIISILQVNVFDRLTAE